MRQIPSGALQSGEAAPWLQSIAIVLITRALFLALAFIAAWMLASGEGRPDIGLEIWHHWDAPIFTRIAEHGYTSPLSDPHSTAFFPLLPLLIAALTALGLGPVAAGMVISAAATIVASIYLYRLAEEEMGVGRTAVLYLCLFPTVVFLIAPYSEPLFLAGAIAAFYYARHRRWVAAGLGAAVAMASRLVGVFVIAGLVTEFLLARDFKRRRLIQGGIGGLIAIVPLAAYSAYLFAVTGDALYFLTDQRLGWGREWPVNPITAFTRTWNAAGSNGYPANWILAWRIEIVAAAVGIGLVAWAAARREWGYAVFMGSTLAVLLTSAWYLSIPRVLLTFWPALLFLASWTRGKGARHDLVVVGFAVAAALGVVVFTQGAWFY